MCADIFWIIICNLQKENISEYKANRSDWLTWIIVRLVDGLVSYPEKNYSMQQNGLSKSTLMKMIQSQTTWSTFYETSKWIQAENKLNCLSPSKWSSSHRFRRREWNHPISFLIIYLWNGWIYIKQTLPWMENLFSKEMSEFKLLVYDTQIELYLWKSSK